jgi:hypothetical protein
MGNPMYPIILQEVTSVLGISRRELESDVRDIAEYWETCLQKVPVGDRDTAIYLLTTYATCYLKGRGVRLSNLKTLKKNNGILVTFVTLVPLYIWKQPENGFPKVHELIPFDIDNSGYQSGVFDILAQAEEILRESWNK